MLELYRMKGIDFQLNLGKAWMISNGYVSWWRGQSGDSPLESLFVARESQDWEPGLTALSSSRLSARSSNKQSVSCPNVSPLFCRSFGGDSKKHFNRIVYVSVAEGFQNVTSWRVFNKHCLFEESDQIFTLKSASLIWHTRLLQPLHCFWWN